MAAQAPGLPVLQDAYFAQGKAVAVNAGGGAGITAVAGAASWAPGARLGFSLGGGVARAGGISQPTAGVRVAFRAKTFGEAQQFAIAAFVGAGTAFRDTISVQRGPIGGTASYRRTLGATRVVAVSVSPYYDATRAKVKGLDAVKDGNFRTSIGADVSVTSSIGVTIGADFGDAMKGQPVLAGSTLSGLGISYRF
jgi:hypothetical protein